MEQWMRLSCKVQHYEWGKIGEDSEVGRLYALMTGTTVDKNLPYAELWMGTHNSGPSTVVLDNHEMLLKDWLRLHPQAFGDEHFGGHLPFLFKVLSVKKALSIQAHPDKKLAEYLHNKYPDLYKDENHKPEMALALSDFGALCGFVSSEELKAIVESVPELQHVLGKEVVESVLRGSEMALKRAFTLLMSLDQTLITEAVVNLVTRLNFKKMEGGLTPKEELVLILGKQYPNDVGILAAFFLNYIKLSPGQALFLNVNEPHSYIYGDCMECMAISDNVVRAGLTPKFRDTQTLCSMVSYKQGLPEISEGTLISRFTKRYSSPLDAFEFEVDHVYVQVGEIAKVVSVRGPSIVLVYRGTGELDKQSISAGNVFLLVAGKEVEVKAVGIDEPLQLYRAGSRSKDYMQQ